MDPLTDQIVRKIEELAPIKMGGCKIVTSEKDEIDKSRKVYRVEIVVPYRALSDAQKIEQEIPKKRGRTRSPFKIDENTISFK